MLDTRQLINPWQGANDQSAENMAVMKQVGDSLRQRAQMDQQAQQNERANRLADMQAQVQQIALAKAQREQLDQEALRQKLQANQPTTQTTVQPSLSALGNLVPGSQYMQPRETGVLANMRAEGLAEPIVNADFRQQPSEMVQAYNEGRVSTKTTPPVDATKIILDHAQKTGNTELYKSTADEVFNRAGQLFKISPDDPTQALDYINGKLGTTYKNAGANKDWQFFEKDGVLTALNKKALLEGKPLSEAAQVLQVSDPKLTKGFDQVDLGDRVKIIPRDGSPVSYEKKKASPNTIIKLSQSESGSTVSADAAAILKGDLAPSDLGKRNGHDARVRAEVRKLDPNFNFNEANANAKFMKSDTINRQYVNLEGVKKPIEDLAALGQKLNNGNFVPGNKWKQAILANTGNTEIVAYRAKRNSVIQELANAMRGAGISEGSIKLELDNFSDAYSPEQIKTATDNTLEVIKAKQAAIRTKPYQGGGNQVTQSAPAAPKPGTLKNGYRFKGGDPADKNSWVKVGG